MDIIFKYIFILENVEQFSDLFKHHAGLWLKFLDAEILPNSNTVLQPTLGTTYLKREALKEWPHLSIDLNFSIHK